MDKLPFDGVAMEKRLQASPYFRALDPLNQFVRGRRVVGSQAGNAGFILLLSDDAWAASFEESGQSGHSMGRGTPAAAVLAMIQRDHFGDGSPSAVPGFDGELSSCDFAAEVAKSHGHALIGLARNEHGFSFAFEDGHELTTICGEDSQGRPAYRVWWDQW